MSVDHWNEHPFALADLLIEALESNNMEILRGIQCFSAATRWTHLQGMESIINTIFEKTTESKKEAKQYLEKLTNDEAHYRQLGVYDVMKQRMEALNEGKIPFPELKSVCQYLSLDKFFENLDMLEAKGFIKTDRSGSWDEASVWLPERLWGTIVEDAITRGQEDTIYSSALGTMIANATQKKTIRTIKAIVNILNRYENDPVPSQDFFQEYRVLGVDVRKAYNFKKRDSSKNIQIRALINDDGRFLQFNREMVLVNKRWREITNTRLRRRGFS